MNVCAYVSETDSNGKTFHCTTVIGAKRVIKREFIKSNNSFNIRMTGYAKEWAEVEKWVPTICNDTVKEWRKK